MKQMSQKRRKTTKKGKLFVISAPSGTGKSTVIADIYRKRGNFFFSISATTRAPREGEQDGVNYHFVSREKFLEMIDNNEFLEYAEYVGNYYGTPIKPILENLEKGLDVILDIEIVGHNLVKQAMPECISIFILPPSLEELEKRLRGRGTDSEEKIAGRLEKAKVEMLEKDKYDYVVVNDVVDRVSDEIIAIMEKEKNIL